MVARVYATNGGFYSGRIEYVENYSNGYVTCVVRHLGGYDTVTVPYACVELTED
jgi:hypothetical protein